LGREFRFPIFPAGILWEWELTVCNFVMGSGIATWEREGIGIDNVAKVPQNTMVSVMSHTQYE